MHKKTELKKQYKKTDETYKLPIIDRENFVFKGWYNNPEFTGEVITEIKKGSSGDIDLYPKWENLPLMTYIMEIGSYYNDSHFQYESNLPYKSEATAVSFDRGIPDLTGIQYTDVSKNKDGTVIAYLDSNKVVHFVSNGIISVEGNAEGMFGDWQVTSINFNDNFDTSQITNMRDMFVMCTELTSLDLSSFNTSNVANMSSMFSGCYLLTSLNLDNWDISSVIDMSYMFDECPATRPPWYN